MRNLKQPDERELVVAMIEPYKHISAYKVDKASLGESQGDAIAAYLTWLSSDFAKEMETKERVNIPDTSDYAARRVQVLHTVANGIGLGIDENPLSAEFFQSKHGPNIAAAIRHERPEEVASIVWDFVLDEVIDRWGVDISEFESVAA